jgi:hypothetical protein
MTALHLAQIKGLTRKTFLISLAQLLFSFFLLAGFTVSSFSTV